MISGKSVLGLIPCRMGSQRVPIKNIREFKIKNKSQSLLSWAVEAAQKSRYLDRIVIASDHISIAHRPGCTALYLPGYIANGTSKNCAIYALSFYPADLLVLLQPTSPYRTAADIDACIEIAAEGDNVFSVNADTLQPNGAVYVSGADCDWANAECKYVMPAARSLDIDFEHQLA